jgi:hypothetical protein
MSKNIIIAVLAAACVGLVAATVLQSRMIESCDRAVKAAVSAAYVLSKN